MSKELVRQALSSAWAVIHRTTENPVDQALVAKLKKAVEVLKEPLEGSPVFSRRMFHLAKDIHSCGLLNVPPRKPQRAEEMMAEIETMEKLLDGNPA
jgi:hypothetical protein